MKTYTSLLCLLITSAFGFSQVGIATTAPKATLDINGTFRIASTIDQEHTGVILVLGDDGLVSKALVPNFYSIPSIKIPICRNSSTGTKNTFTVTIQNEVYNVTSEVISKRIGAVRTFPITTQNLIVSYTFDKPLPFTPKGISISALNNSDYPDTFNITYAAISNNSITVSIYRKDIDSADDQDNCWAGQFYFDVLAYSF
ncbi:hypothetical protein ACG2LH_13285 [Zhouia sp. PK063]|uniref:hypothetical protein n=1 Tax=Zhouia sp. PK063 TaxID=3373602 RepID=UPI00379CB152